MKAVIKFAATAAAATLITLLLPTAGAAETHTAATIYQADTATQSTRHVEVTGLGPRTVTVNWGDGTTQAFAGTCTIKQAKRAPHKCVKRTQHTYDAPGSYTITVRAGGKELNTGTTTVRPDAWKQPDSWEQPKGWATLTGEALFAPCSNITYSINAADTPRDREALNANIPAALQVLSAETNLTFTPVEQPGAAKLRFTWGDLTAKNPDAAGLALVWKGHSTITLSTTSWWTTDTFQGLGMVKTKNGQVAGNSWLVIHEVMHALGYAHVEDKHSVMNANATGDAKFTPEDLQGLHTLYKNQPCAAVTERPAS